MLVSSLIDMAVMQYPNLSRELVRSYINEIQKMILCKSPVDCLRVINDDDGYYTFSVTPNQKEYVLDSTTTGDYNIYNVVSIKDKNMEEYFIKQGDGNNAAVITFKKEYTKDTMSVIAYRQPNVIATEYDGLDFPDIYILSHFYIALQGLIENIHYNNPDKLLTFTEQMLPPLLYKLNNNSNLYINRNDYGFWGTQGGTSKYE